MLDNNFTGWNGLAVIDWPSAETRLTVEATPPFRHAVIYVPPIRTISASSRSAT